MQTVSLDIKDYVIYQEDGDYGITQDSILLFHFANVKQKDRVLDLGCGNGILSILSTIKAQSQYVFGIDKQEDKIALAQKAIMDNGLEDIAFQVGDVKSIKSIVKPESFDKVLCNPPYFYGEVKTQKSKSRIFEDTTLQDFINAASYALNFGGELAISYKAENISELIAALKQNNLEPKELIEVLPKLNSNPDIVIIRAKKGGKVSLKWSHFIVQNEDGTYTKEFNQIYNG